MSVQWAYFRKGWVSCAKAQEVLAGQNKSVVETVDARKEKIEADAAWKLFQKYSTVIIGRGKKYETYEPVDENKDIILKQALGRSGNLRAPSLEIAYCCKK